MKTINDLQRKKETRNTSTKAKNHPKTKTSQNISPHKKPQKNGTHTPKKITKPKISKNFQALSGLLNQANIQLVPAATFGVLDEAMGPDGFVAPCG